VLRIARGMAATVLMLGFATGCGSSKKTSTASDGGVTASAGGGTPVSVNAGDTSDTVQSLTVEPLTVKAGKVTFTFKNTGTRQHEMIVLKTDEAFDALKVDPTTNKVSEDTSVGEVSETDKGKTVTKTLDLVAGKYVLVCNIEKHYTQGMKSAFTVTP
jgi:uncharacterized cupredoxin-like copper-binding protein